MNILCLVKFTPDVEEMKYDERTHTLVRDNVKQIINPEDACALGFALRIKKKNPDINIEVVSMAPLSSIKLMEDILRRKADKGTLISDKKYAGSDTLATSFILSSYLKTTDYDVILTGDHSIDGDTAQIPSELAEFLEIEQISSVISIDETSLLQGRPVVTVDNDIYIDTYEAEFPVILSISRTSRIKLPFVRYADLDLDVSDKLKVVTNEDLTLPEEKIGLKGSATKVVKAWPTTYEEKKERIVVKSDEKGVETVYAFLKENGYLS